MSGSRGVVRRTKRRRDPDAQNAVIDRLERQTLAYLEEQLKITIASPGNADEAVRIIKAIRQFRQGDAPKSDGRAALQGLFRLDAGLASEREQPPSEPGPSGDQEA